MCESKQPGGSIPQMLVFHDTEPDCDCDYTNGSTTVSVWSAASHWLMDQKTGVTCNGVVAGCPTPRLHLGNM